MLHLVLLAVYLNPQPDVPKVIFQIEPVVSRGHVTHLRFKLTNTTESIIKAFSPNMRDPVAVDTTPDIPLESVASVPALVSTGFDSIPPKGSLVGGPHPMAYFFKGAKPGKYTFNFKYSDARAKDFGKTLGMRSDVGTLWAQPLRLQLLRDGRVVLFKGSKK